MPKVIEEFATDIRYGVWQLRKDSAFTIIAILTLALGFGANMAVFSVLDPLLLRSLPVTAPNELVTLHSVGTLQEIDIAERAAFDRYSMQRDVFAGVLADAGLSEYQTSYDGIASTAGGEIVSANFFAVLGVRPFLARLLVPDDDVTAISVVVLGHGYWRRAFAANPSVVGRTLIVNGKAATIVGVAPPDFFGLRVGSSPDFYAPFASGLSPAAWVTIVARLKSGVTLMQAQAALEPVFTQIVRASAVPEIERQQAMAQLLVRPASRGLSSLRAQVERPAWILMGVVVLVLLVACANVANLMLARSAGRRREIATQLALGATRGRLIRQFVVESGILAGTGAVAGVLVAHWITPVLVSSLSIGRAPVTLTTGMNLRMLIFGVSMLSLTILCCGVFPALASTASSLMDDLKSTRAGFSYGRHRSLAGQLLVVVQLGVSVTLLATAGLLLHSLVNLNTFDVGFDRSRILSVSLADRAVNRPPGQATDVLTRLIAGARSLPGVESASLTAITPLTGNEIGINVAVDGQQPGAAPHALLNSVSPGYFATMGIPLIAGRDFPVNDDLASGPFVIINRKMARHYFGDESPLGKELKFVEGDRPPMEIIGVVADAIYNDLREQTPDFLYLRRSAQAASVRAVLLVRTNPGGVGALIAPIRQLIHSLDGDLTVNSAKTLDEIAEESIQGNRVVAQLCSVFSLLALVVAGIGLYGLLSMSVAQQRRDISIRIALGADGLQILRFVAGQGARLVAAGLVFGTGGAFLGTSMVASMLFGLHRMDPMTSLGVVLTLSGAAVLACYFPARRAMKINPAIALRAE